MAKYLPMLKIPPNYRIPVGISIALHLVLLVFLAIKLPTSHFRMESASSDVKIVNAVAVNSAAVQTEINRIKMQEQQKQQQVQQQRAAEQARVQALQQQAIAAQKQRQVEQARVAQLQAERLRLQKEADLAAAEKKKLLQVKAEKAEQARQLAVKQQQLQQKMMKDQLAQEQKQLQQQLIKDQMAQEQKQLAQARSVEMQGVVDQYKSQIIQAIQQQWLVPDNANKSLSCVLLIRLAPNGVVLSVETVQTSGDTVLDRSARDAVYKASPLPVPQDPAVFASFRELRLTVRPLQVTNG
jgi:colicin import membrane protein